jgi:hypothetical protein
MKRPAGAPRFLWGSRVRTETAMNKPSLAALSTAVLVAGMAAAAAGPRDNANAPAAGMQSSAKPQSGKAVTQTSDTLTLSDAQRKLAWQDLYMDSLNQDTPAGFNAVVGASVPNTIVIAPVTAQAGSDVPALKPYAFAMVQKKLVIVDPSNRKIADVIAR